MTDETQELQPTEEFDVLAELEREEAMSAPAFDSALDAMFAKPPTPAPVEELH